MTDAFEELGLPRRPEVDPAAVHSRYLELAAIRHPDRNGGDPEPLGRLNHARGILLSDPLRLRHLIDLAFPGHTQQASFNPDFTLFSRIGHLAKSASAAAQKKEKNNSPLADALADAERAELLAEVTSAKAYLGRQSDLLKEKIRALDRKWPDATPEDLTLLAAEAAFLARWSESLREAEVSLLGG